jgi:DNA-binding FadR family transcriptional regulator
LRGTKLSRVVATTLVEDIISQDLKAGDRLPSEAAMVERFEVGRASIREGLRLLEMYGVVSIRPGQNGGPVVADMTPNDLARTLSLFFRMTGATYRDLIQARLVIEPVMARLAAEAQDPKQMEELRRVMEAEQNAAPEQYVERSTTFHYTVSGLSGNPVLDMVGRTLRVLYSERLTAAGLVPAEARPGIRAVHGEIGEAILSGDVDRAEQLMHDHMQELAELQAERTPWFMDERVSWDV